MRAGFWIGGFPQWVLAMFRLWKMIGDTPNNSINAGGFWLIGD
jgi:hypothetical protein